MATEYKVVLLGAKRVGKSSLAVRLIENHFRTEDHQTIEDLFTKKLDIDNELCLLDILDTCGTDKFSQIKQQHISYAQGFVLVFAVNNKRTFEDIEIIRMQVRQETDRGRVPGWKLFGGREWCMICRAKKFISVPTILVANKVDLPNPEVDLKQVKEYAETHNMLYTETSAQTGQGVQHAFQTLIQEIQNKRQQKAGKDACSIV
ncbi:hypothetical protein EMCRGX_G035031 [Ephydatia muelleri]